uniref:Uncharacterized protein n=1 Tax=Triticum urartu TaxID=4572 RepID=A0A8R7R460_TRIUA
MKERDQKQKNCRNLTVWTVSQITVFHRKKIKHCTQNIIDHQWNRPIQTTQPSISHSDRVKHLQGIN